MPIVEAGFHSEDGKAEHEKLLRYGPTIQVTVGSMPTDEPTSEEELESALALIDTGASESCIDINLAKKLRLPVVDVQQVSGAAGSSQHDIFMAQVEIPTLRFSQYGGFIGVDLSGGGQPHSVLLGRTFLRSTIMIYNGIRGQVTLTSNY